MTRVSLLLLLALAGCEWVRLPVDDAVYDADGDGYTSLDDCDDFNENVHPGAEEACNGVDNDCSGSEEDAADAGLWYPDLDGDGYGDPGAALRACEVPLGYTDLAWDCDDGDASVNPGAVEGDCGDARDYNCDGLPSSWDSDLDGSPGCEDCDDADPTTFPGATETCDGRDEDCDGEVDEGLTGTTW
ncbi:MAG: putative metal-binding motif-containing protein, partial [Myxococcota bacterium]